MTCAQCEKLREMVATLSDAVLELSRLLPHPPVPPLPEPETEAKS